MGSNLNISVLISSLEIKKIKISEMIKNNKLSPTPNHILNESGNNEHTVCNAQ